MFCAFQRLRFSRCAPLIVTAAILSTIAAAAKSSQSAMGPPTNALSPERVTWISIPGELEAADPVWVGRRVVHWRHRSDVIERIVPEGSQVKEGDFLLQMDLTARKREEQASEAKVKNAELKVASAESRLSVLKSELEAEQEKGPARLASYRLVVERLKSFPDPVDLSKAESELARLRAVLAEAQNHCKAVEALAERGMASEQALVEARFARDITAAEAECAAARLEEVRRGADPYEIAIAELEADKAHIDTELEVARLKVEVAEAQLYLRRVSAALARSRKELEFWQEQVALGIRHAPADGIVVYEKAYVGGDRPEKVGAGTRLGRGQRIIAIISGRAFNFRGKAGEALLGRITAGQPVRVCLDALPETVLRGHVEGIDISLAEQAKVRQSLSDLERPRPKVFDVLIALDEVPEGLMPGLSGKALIDVEQAPVVLDLSLAGRGEPKRSTLPPHWLANRDEMRSEPVSGSRFPGYVDTVEKTAIFTGGDVAGDVTSIVPPYARIEEGGVILECTGDRAHAKLVEAELEPELAEGELKQSRMRAEAESCRWQAEIEKARLAVRAAELRLKQLQSGPSPGVLKMAKARLRKAELELARARRLFEVAQAAGLDSQHDLEAKELEVQLAELRVEEAKTNLAVLRKGASTDSLEQAKFRLEEAREDLSHLEGMAAQSARVQESAIAEAQTVLQCAEEGFQYARARFDKRILRSPIAGNVIFNPKPKWIGGRVGLGDALPAPPICIGHVADLSKLKFCAVVEEPYIPRIKLGGRARVALLALPDKPLKGTVSAIMPLVMDREDVRSPEGTARRLSGVRSTRVDILLELPGDGHIRILPGMTGAAVMVPEQDVE